MFVQKFDTKTSQSIYSTVGKHTLPGKYPCTKFKRVNVHVHVAASIQMYMHANFIQGKRPCRWKYRIVGNFRQEKNFSPVLNFNDCIEDMVTLAIVAKMNSTKCFCNRKVQGGWA